MKVLKGLSLHILVNYAHNYVSRVSLRIITRAVFFNLNTYVQY